MITVKYYANLRQITGINQDSLDYEESTLGCLIDDLDRKYGEPFSRLMTEGGKLRQNVIILLNGLNVIFGKGLDEKIKSGDSVDIFPPVAGG
ncbi:MoaD, archaeal [mine drainage metagenome]|uniref:MoaD, archaeal n=1 Tax=mine drainage metagenome TaxID=410659 RepID=T0ZWW6_9ZZZZ